jgi:hypothetical protein
MGIYRVARMLLIIGRENMNFESFDMELYTVENEDEYDKTRLRVRFKGDLIGFCSTRAEAYDIMEEHANSPCVSTEVSADMADMEQQIIDLAQEVDYMESERDYWKELAGDVTKAVDEERKRAWNENKAFQWDLAEQNAEMRKQLTEKHNDNARLQGQLAQAHNKLKVALQLQPQTDYKEIVDKVNILWEERYDS